MQFIEIKRKKEISIRILFLFKVAARKSREKRIIGIEQLKVAREKKIKQLKGLDQDFSKLEKERMNLMRAVQSFAQHFALTTWKFIPVLFYVLKTSYYSIRRISKMSFNDNYEYVYLSR